MKRTQLSLKLVTAGALLFGALWFPQPSTAYRQCTPDENYTCSRMGGPKVVCSPYHYCFQNSCYAQCSGFTTNCVPADNNCEPIPIP